MNEKERWKKACNDVQAAFVSHYLRHGVKINQTQMKTFAKSIKEDAKVAKKLLFDDDEDDHDRGCLCYHHAIIRAGATRAPSDEYKDALRVGMTIVSRYLENLS